ncbi:hypothetical protein [Nocardioides lacusdianchii]|uniref:hypothetical protein n=1 Tax=Nocardioides lacusdianchii TaxID=2783664 RepID=UPI001CCB59DE|nr:hypothetical protein [Nocardioides lacusdianchii]
MNDDTTLSDDPTSTPAPDPIALVKPKRFTVDEVLASARRIERTANVCVRGDLQAEFDELLDELATLVTATGELMEDDTDEALGDVTARTRVAQINERIPVLRREMAQAMWSVRFRGMSSDEWAPFVKKNMPEKGDKKDFFNLLLSKTAIEPELTLDQVRELRKVFTQRSINELVNKAWEACTEGGIDVPKLPLSLRRTHS